MRVFHKLSIAVCVLLTTAVAFGQTENATYIVDRPISLYPVADTTVTGIGTTIPNPHAGFLVGPNPIAQPLPVGCQFEIVSVFKEPKDTINTAVTKAVLIVITQLPSNVTSPTIGTYFEIDNFEYLNKRFFHSDKSIVSVQHTLLSVPFRYQFKDSSVQPGGTIGDFIEVTPTFAKDVHFGAFLGISALSGTTFTKASIVTSTSTFGLTGGVGLIVDIPGGDFQAGFIIGLDHIGSVGTTYAYNDRPWVGFSLGFKFIGN